MKKQSQDKVDELAACHWKRDSASHMATASGCRGSLRNHGRRGGAFPAAPLVSKIIEEVTFLHLPVTDLLNLNGILNNFSRDNGPKTFLASGPSHLLLVLQGSLLPSCFTSLSCR